MREYKIRNIMCSNREVCVVYETARWLWHKIFFFIKTHTPVWYQFDEKHQPGEPPRETLPLDEDWYRIRRPLYRHEHVYYDLDKALKANPNVKGVALIFFMGIGDYLYTTPMLAELKRNIRACRFTRTWAHSLTATTRRWWANCWKKTRILTKYSISTGCVIR